MIAFQYIQVPIFVECFWGLQMHYMFFSRMYLSCFLIAIDNALKIKRWFGFYIHNILKRQNSLFTVLWSIKTIQFIIFLKKRRLFEKQDSPYLPQNIVFTIADSVNKGDFTVVLSDIQIKSKGKRFAGNDCLLQLMPSPIQIGNIKVTGVNSCSHICNISSELVWVSDKKHSCFGKYKRRNSASS